MIDLFILAILFFIIANTVDLISTYIAVRKTELEEKNFLFKEMINKYPESVFLIKIILVSTFICFSHPFYLIFPLLTLFIWFLSVIVISPCKTLSFFFRFETWPFCSSLTLSTVTKSEG